MNCIDDELIQKYIDGELDDSLVIEVQNHVRSCSVCENKLNRQVKITAGIKKLIENLTDEKIEIPEFKMIPRVERKKGVGKMLLYDMSAAAVILIFVGIQMFQEEKVPSDKMIFFQLENEYDANLPITEQEMNFDFFDEYGRMIKK